jgi:hypothetical protein
MAHGPAQCHAASVTLRWPALAGRGLAPGAAVPCTGLSHGDGCVRINVVPVPLGDSPTRHDAACLRGHVGTNALVAVALPASAVPSH